MMLWLTIEVGEGKGDWAFTVPFAECMTKEEFIASGQLSDGLKKFVDSAIARLRSDVLKEMMKEKQ